MERIVKKGLKNHKCNGPGGFGATGMDPDGLRVVVAVGGMKLDGLDFGRELGFLGIRARSVGRFTDERSGNLSMTH